MEMALTQPELPSKVQEQVLQLVTFTLGEEEYGIPILQVQEIIRPVAITVVPKAPPFIEGVINLRGQVVPVVNLRRRLGLPDLEGLSEEARIIVVEVQGRTAGLLVDGVSEVFRLGVNQIEPPPTLEQGHREYIQGVGRMGDRLIVLLDLKWLMRHGHER